MEPGIAAVAYTAETAVEATAGAAIAIAQPTLPIKGRWTPISLSLPPPPSPTTGPLNKPIIQPSPSLSLTNPQTAFLLFPPHSADSGSDSDATPPAYLLSLPGPAGAAPDIQTIPARPAKAGGPLPPARIGHTAVTIGPFIYIYGGRQPARDGRDAGVLDEAGKVWAFDTKLRVWSLLEPVTTLGGVSCPLPSPRWKHTSVASEVPRPQAVTQAKVRPEVEREEKLRDEGREGDEVAAAAADASVEAFGTVFVHGGIDGDMVALRDFWAFDVASRTWRRLPDAPEPGREGTAMTLVGDRVYRFGGHGRGKLFGGGLDYLELAKETVDDKGGKAEVGVTSKKGEKGEWKTVEFKEVEVKDKESQKDGKGETRVAVGPEARFGAAMHRVTTGQGRNYLVLLLGQKWAPDTLRGSASEFLDDIWAYQLPPDRGTGASIKDAVRGLIGMKEYQGTWARVEVAEASMEDGVHEKGPGGRAWFANDVNEEGKIVIWGGQNNAGMVADGWVLEIE